MDFINIIGTLFDNSVEHTSVIANQVKDLRLNKYQQDINEDVYNQIQITKELKEKSKGYYDSYQSLIQNISSPEIGDWAIVKNSDNGKWYIYKCVVRGYWKETEEEYSSNINLSEYSKKSELKTINGQPIYGEGDIETGEKYEIVSQDNDGLLSKDFYVQLLKMRNETLPEIQEHLNNILSLFDNEQTSENIQTIIDRYNQICKFIADLGSLDNTQILQQINSDVDLLKDEVSYIESDISTNIKKDLTEVKDNIAEINAVIGTINQELEINSEIREDLTEAKNNILEINGAIERINQVLESSNASNAEKFLEIYERLQNIETASGGNLDEINNSITAINNSITTVNEDIDSLESNITTISSDIDSLKDNVTNINSSITDINHDISGVNSSITTINNNIDSLEENVTTINNDINSLEEDVTTINTGISGINNDIDSLENNIENIGTRVQQLEQNQPRDSIKHVFITQSAYDALTTYEKDTLYLIIEQTSVEGSKLGEDAFPLILGEDTFPLILG